MSNFIIDDLDPKGMIYDFDVLMEEVMYAYDPNYPIIKTSDGFYIVHKLTVGGNFIEYKGNYNALAPGLYDQLDKFFTIERGE